MNRRTLTIALAALCLSVPASALMAIESRAGQPILTVTGNVSQANRPAFDEFSDAYLNFREKRFGKAYEFTLESLQSLPQKTITAQAEKWPGPVELTGAALTDVLAQAGASGKPVTVTALDGYAVTYTPDEIASQDWILAWQANGKPLSIGGRGPLWLVHSSGPTPAPDDIEARWIWSVFVIEAGS